MICTHGQLARQCELCDKDREIAQLRAAAEEARRVLEEVAFDLATDQLAQCRQMYQVAGYKPHRIKAAEDDLTAVQNSIAQLKVALGKQDEERT